MGGVRGQEVTLSLFVNTVQNHRLPILASRHSVILLALIAEDG